MRNISHLFKPYFPPFKNLCIVFLLFLISCGSPKSQLINYSSPLAEIIDSLEIKNAIFDIYIDKSDYTLSLIFDGDTIKQYPVVFGGNPNDDKLRQGDQCTPEGSFGIISKYPHRSWSKFIWIDYPNDDSRRKFNAARASGKIPDDADIGGEIGIHGVPEGQDLMIDLKHNWTLGCISLKNSDINELYQFIGEDSRVVIIK